MKPTSRSVGTNLRNVTAVCLHEKHPFGRTGLGEAVGGGGGSLAPSRGAEPGGRRGAGTTLCLSGAGVGRIMFSCKQLIRHLVGYAGKRMLVDRVVDAQQTLQNKWKIVYTIIY